MKKIFKLVALSIASIAMIAGCAKFDNSDRVSKMTNSNGEYAIMFSNSPATKATVSPVSNQGYDEFSLYAWNSNSEVIMNPFTVQADGSAAYKYDGVNNQTLQYFKNNADNYSFIGVIPSTTATLNNNSVTVGVESFVVDDKKAEGNGVKVDSPKEFLWAYTNVVKDDYNKNVTLPFKHGNALLYLGFISDRDDTELLDYVPTTPAVPASPGTPDTETYTKKTTKFIDELVAGNEVQVAIGFYGASSPKLTETQPNPLYVGSDNTSNGWLAKTWLLSIKDAVNAQFVYYRLNEVNNSTSKTETTEDWESAASNKNIFMMKLADGVDKAEFAAGNDVFWNALVAHDAGTTEPWFGGSPAMSFKQTFAQAYANGWRVVRINVSDANANQVLVFLSNNFEVSTQVCTITPGTPATPGSPEIPGIDGIRVFSAKADATNGYAHVEHTMTADATVSTNLSFTNMVTSSDVIQYSLPEGDVKQYTGDVTDVNNRGEIENTFAIYSPTTFYAIPCDTDLTHFVVKLSYTYNRTTVYDVRVPIALPTEGLEAGKYYKYIVNITSIGNGTNDPDEADREKGDIDIVDNPIKVIVNITDYEKGDTKIITI